MTTLVHGTFRTNVESILKSGLSQCGRNHIHLTTMVIPDPHKDNNGTGSDGAVSGFRSSCDTLIYINMQKAIQDGMQFFQSENGVVLTEGFNGVIGKEYFEKIVCRRTGDLIPIT